MWAHDAKPIKSVKKPTEKKIINDRQAKHHNFDEKWYDNSTLFGSAIGMREKRPVLSEKNSRAQHTPVYARRKSYATSKMFLSSHTRIHTVLYLFIYLSQYTMMKTRSTKNLLLFYSFFFLFAAFFSFLPFFTVCVCYIHPFSSVIFVYAMTATNSMNRRRKKSPHKYGKWRRGKKLCVCKIEKEKDGSIKGWVSWGNEWYEDRKWKYSCF